jgi:hypothetical protein
MRAAAAAAVLYFLAAFGAGFLLGPIRVLVLEPRLGAFAAVLIEAPLLLAANVVAAPVVPRLVTAEGAIYIALLFASALVPVFVNRRP